MSLRFGTDGVRGRAFDELTTEFAEHLGTAAAEVLGAGRWIVGHDPRASSPVLAAAVAAGLVAGGATVQSAGMLPTPAVAAIGAALDVPTAMITASHNPWYDNGIKLFAAGGRKLRDDVEERIEALLHGRSPGPAAATTDVPGVPSIESFDGRSVYLDRLLGGFPDDCLRGLRIVVDCANGAFSDLAPDALGALGAEVVVVHAEPDGRNINDHCGATHPEHLAEQVVIHQATLGLAFDGDGDRVIAVDHLGRIVDGDRLIAMAALHLKDHGRLTGNAVVVTVMSNLGFHRAMEAAGIEVVTTAVGDRYVLEALDARGLAVGGEQSGHIIYRQSATTGDGLLAGLHLAQFVAEHHEPLATVAERVMTTYPQVLVNVRVAGRHPAVAEELATEIAEAESGLGDSGRVLLRPSGTEPLIRVMVEAQTAALARSVADDLAAVVLDRFGHQPTTDR